MSDHIPEPLFEPDGHLNTSLARRRCGTLATAVRLGVAAADHVATAREEYGTLDEALDALAAWANVERARWYLKG